jgi:hypothetical protein
MARSSSNRPPSRRASPQPPAAANPPSQKPKNNKAAKRKDDYTSDGVEDNDVFLLPGSDFQLVLAITVVCAAVRLFRIYQPTSVVFDEVQYVRPGLLCCARGIEADQARATASADSRPSTSRANSSWTSTPRLPS